MTTVPDISGTIAKDPSNASSGQRGGLRYIGEASPANGGGKVWTVVSDGGCWGPVDATGVLHNIGSEFGPYPVNSQCRYDGAKVMYQPGYDWIHDTPHVNPTAYFYVFSPTAGS
jgi:hypothetical protein